MRKIAFLVGAAVFLLCLWAFAEIAEDYPEGRFQTFDETVLRAFRQPDNLGVPRGPLWLKSVVRDVTALGSTTVLTMGVLGVVGYLLLLGRRHAAWAIAGTALGGLGMNVLLKSITDRPRPDIVPHFAEVTSSSFPSGHTLLSAIIYLSVGTMVARQINSHVIAWYAIGFAMLLTFLVGCSRVYLGVHFPSDVIGGWVAGTAWTLLCVATEDFLQSRRAARK